MTRVEEVLESVGAAKFITILDLAKGYWQIPIAKDSQEKTAFTTPLRVPGDAFWAPQHTSYV